MMETLNAAEMRSGRLFESLSRAARAIPSEPRAARVIKLGGSLLELDDLIPRLRKWLVRQKRARNYLVVGGGERVEAIRRHAKQWDDATAHWMCLEAMDANAHQFADRWSSTPAVGRWGDLQQPHATVGTWQQVRVLLPFRLLSQLERRQRAEFASRITTLPVGWHVTSDSIAAYFAECLTADELVLLKSCLPPTADLDNERPVMHREGIAAATRAWQQAGYVDAYFGEAAARLRRVRCVDLRHDLREAGWSRF